MGAVRPRGEDEVSLWEAEDVQSWVRGHPPLAHLAGPLQQGEVTGQELAVATEDWAREFLGLHDDRDIARLLAARDALTSGYDDDYF